jgi:hypothetical protein
MQSANSPLEFSRGHIDHRLDLVDLFGNRAEAIQSKEQPQGDKSNSFISVDERAISSQSKTVCGSELRDICAGFLGKEVARPGER